MADRFAVWNEDHRDDRRLKVNWDRSFHQNRRTTRER